MNNKLVCTLLLSAVALSACGGRDRWFSDKDEIRHALRHGRSPDDRLGAVLDLAGRLNERDFAPDRSDWGPGKVPAQLESIVDDLILASCCDVDIRVRAAALTLLAELRPPRAKRVFVAAALTEPDESVRADAVFALDRYGDPAYLRPLVSLWDQVIPRGDFETTQENLRRAFARMIGKTEPLVRELLASRVRKVSLSALWVLCAGNRARAADLRGMDLHAPEVQEDLAFWNLESVCSRGTADEDLYSSYERERTTQPLPPP